MRVAEFESNEGVIHRYPLHNDDMYECGEWFHPFPNERGNSTAFGLWETLAQCDECPQDLYRSGCRRIKVSEVVEDGV